MFFVTFSVDEVGIHGPSLVIDGSEYWFVLDKHLSYQEASFYCEKNDSDLASVESYTKLRAVLSQIDMVIKSVTLYYENVFIAMFRA